MATNLDILVRAVDEASKPLNKIEGNIDDLDKSATRTNKRFGGLKSALGTGLKVAAGAAAIGVGALAFALKDSIGLARTQINAEKQLDAVLKSTGGIAGITAEEIKKMASELQGVTNFGDEATIAGQSMLLTFTNIGKDVFPAATETMLNMSQAMGTDMKSSAIQLGKALNNPTEGISALSRVGIAFTKQQKAQIKAMQDAGDIAGAQTIILKELETQFGGSARALADPAIQLSNAWGDFQEEIGKVILPMLNRLAVKVLPVVMDAITKLSDFVADLSAQFADSGSEINTTITNIKNWILDNFGFVIDWWTTNLPLIQDTVTTIMGAIRKIFSGEGEGGAIIAFVTAIVDHLVGTFKVALEIALSIITLGMQLITGDFEGAGETIKGIFTTLKDFIIHTITTLGPALFNAARAVITGLANVFMEIDWGSVGMAIIQGIASGISAAGGIIADASRGAARSAFEAAKSVRGIRSPSKVTGEKIGKPFAQGIAVGISKELSAIKMGVSSGMGSLVGGMGAAPAAVGAGGNYNITVNMSGGGYSSGRAAGAGIADELRARGLR